MRYRADADQQRRVIIHRKTDKCKMPKTPDPNSSKLFSILLYRSPIHFSKAKKNDRTIEWNVNNMRYCYNFHKHRSRSRRLYYAV